MQFSNLAQHCTKCTLCAHRTQVVLPSLPPSRGLLAIGEAPGADEDVAGEGFVGRAGKTLDRLLAAEGIARNQYGRANICRCRPVDENGKNRAPSPVEMEACLPLLAEFIADTSPKVILGVGWSSSKFFSPQKNLSDAILAPIQTFHPNVLGLPSLLQYIRQPVSVVFMPHTSPLAFNRNAPNGEKWADVAKRQVSKAVALLGRIES